MGHARKSGAGTGCRGTRGRHVGRLAPAVSEAGGDKTRRRWDFNEKNGSAHPSSGVWALGMGWHWSV